MTLLEDCVKIGDKYYVATDVQKIFDSRISDVVPEDLPVE